MKFNTYLEKFLKDFEPVFSATMTSWAENSSKKAPTLSPVLKEFIKQNKGGKRIRPALVKLGYELAGGDKNDKNILHPAIAFEVFQTAILTHDDIIDKSTLRRGKKSIHEALGGNHYGVSQAISLGDLGFFYSMQILAESDFPDVDKNKALGYFTKIIQETLLGEMLDVQIPTQKIVAIEDTITIASLKTASYSITGPLTLGSILGGGAQTNNIRDIKMFGDNLGIAYQLLDDLQGIYSDEKITGKSSMSDMKEGKRTILYIYAYAHASESDRKIITKLYGNNKLQAKDAELIRKIFKNSGAHEFTINEIEKYTKRSQEFITSLTNKKELHDLLNNMTTYLLKREH